MTLSPSSTRPRLAVLAALAVAAAPLALPAAAGCGSESATGCGIDQDRTSALPASVRTITAVLPPRTDGDGTALSLYASLLPEGYEMPATAQVAVTLSQVDVPRCGTAAAPGAPVGPALPCDAVAQAGTTSWVQGALSLRVATAAGDGWYPLSTPTSSTRVLEEARATGQPAYLATGGVVAEGTGWTGTVAVGAAQAVRMAWTPGGGGLVPGSAFDLAAGKTPTFGVTPLRTGTDRWRTSEAVRPTVPASDVTGPLAAVPSVAVQGVNRSSFVQRGQVRLALDLDVDALDSASPSPLPDLGLPEGRTLADLVDAEQSVPGLFRSDDGLLVTQSENLDDGDGNLPPLPVQQQVIAAGPSASGYGYVNPALLNGPGGTVTFANLDTDDHTVTAELTGPNGRPLFDVVVSGGETAEVPGTALLGPGTYRFLCTLHPLMQGQLIVQ